MSSRLARSAGLIGLATFTSRILGLVREVLFAAFFGAMAGMDAFLVAARIPNLLRDLFAEGAMSAAFVPTFTRELVAGGKEKAWRLGSQVLNALLLITGVIVVIGILLAGPFISLYAGEYADVPGKLELTTSLTRFTLPFLTLVAVAAALMGMLNSLRRFFAPAISPATYNVVMIVCVIALYPLFSAYGYPPIYSLAVGTLLGGLAQVAAQVPALRAEGYRHVWVIDWRDPALRRVLTLMGPGTIGVAAAQINLFVNTQLATSGDGWVSWLQYAFRLMYLPIGIFGVSVATAAVPDLVRQAAEGLSREMRSTVSSALRLSLMLGVPSAVGLVALAMPISELMFERGRFLPTDTVAVAAALAFYAPGLIGYSIVKLASPSFYALGDAKTPVMVSFVSIGTNLAFNLALVRVMGYQGLALGTSIAATVNASLLLWLLSRRIGGIEASRVAVALFKILAASAAMAVVAMLTEGQVRAWLPDARSLDGWVGPLLVRTARVGLGIGAGLIALAAASHLLRIAEFQQAASRVRNRLRGAARR